MVSYSNSSIPDFTLSEIELIRQGNSSAVSSFIKVCEPFIKRFANKFAPPNSFNYDELIQAGRIAAINAVRCFNKNKGNLFGYVYKSIITGIHEEGRRAKRRIQFVCWSEVHPNEDYFSNRFGVKHEEFDMLVRKDALPIIQKRISQWRAGLSTQKQKVIDLIFYRGMNQSQAASQMTLSRTRIGQIMREILDSGKICLADIAELN